MLTQETLKQYLSYDPETGIFIRNKVGGRRVDLVGAIAGGINTLGYVVISLNCKRLLAHRLAWLYMTGNDPINEIDHINGIPSDNRFSNLREADRFINTQNIKRHKKNNKDGILGVQKRESGRYSSKIMINKKIFCLGTFDTSEEAYQVYIEAKRKYHKGNTI